MKYQSPLTIDATEAVDILEDLKDKIHTRVILRMDKNPDETSFLLINVGRDASPTAAGHILYPGDAVEIEKGEVENKDGKISIYSSSDGNVLFFNIA